MKVFGVGPNKSGTVSIKEACKQLGLRVLHDRNDRGMEIIESFKNGDLHPAIAEYDVFLDAPYYEVINEIRTLVNDCRFIHLSREYNDWIASRIAHCFYSRVMKINDWNTINTVGWEKEYQWILNIIEKSLRETDQVVTMNVSTGDGWKQLCQLIGCRIPDTPFPFLHTASEKLLRIHSAMSQRRPVGYAPIILGQRTSVNWLSAERQLDGWSKDWPIRLGWWDEVFKMPFRIYRHELQMIAKKNWARIIGLDSIVSLFKWKPELFHDAIIIPIDDDDWLDPKICEVIRESLGWNQEITAVSWSTERIECAERYAIRKCGQKDWYITNGYALTPAYRDYSGDDQFRDSLSWHFKAAKHTNQKSNHVDKTLGIAPYSWGSVSKLKQYENSQELRETALRSVKWHKEVHPLTMTDTNNTYETEFRELYELNSSLLEGIK